MGRPKVYGNHIDPFRIREKERAHLAWLTAAWTHVVRFRYAKL